MGDRFEKMVERNYELNRVMDHDGVWKRETADLLRKEHAAVRRMVEKQQRYRQGSDQMYPDRLNQSEFISAKDLLAALDRRAKGGTKE